MAGAVDTVGDTGEDMVCTLSIPIRPHPMQVIHMLQMLGPGLNLSTVVNVRQMAKSPTNPKEAHLLRLMQQLNTISTKHHQNIQTKTGLGCFVRLNA